MPSYGFIYARFSLRFQVISYLGIMGVSLCWLAIRQTMSLNYGLRMVAYLWWVLWAPFPMERSGLACLQFCSWMEVTREHQLPCSSAFLDYLQAKYNRVAIEGSAIFRGLPIYIYVYVGVSWLLQYSSCKFLVRSGQVSSIRVLPSN